MAKNGNKTDVERRREFTTVEMPKNGNATAVEQRYCETPSPGAIGANEPENRLYSQFFFVDFVTFRGLAIRIPSQLLNDGEGILRNGGEGIFSLFCD